MINKIYCGRIYNGSNKMLTVNYDDDNYEYAEVTATFEVGITTVEFSPELENPNEWTLLIDSINKGNDYHLSSVGYQSDYCINYKGGILSISLSEYGSCKVGTLKVTIPLTPQNLQTLEELRNLAQAITDRVKYVQ